MENAESKRQSRMLLDGGPAHNLESGSKRESGESGARE